MSRGLFITFEGGEGSGKSTQLRLLAAFLRAEGREVVETREPGGSALGERIRALLLDPGTRMDPVAQFLLFSAARRDHVVSLIAPAVARGAVVLCDRFADSSRAYQGAAGAVGPALIAMVEAAAVNAMRPDLTLLLDIAPERGLLRAKARLGGSLAEGDAFEAADIDFHRRVRDGYLGIARAEPERVHIVEADRAQDEIASDIRKLVAGATALLQRGRTNG
ncbi:MAG: dTMP kinase [Beijerinckiaceae bacterium]